MALRDKPDLFWDLSIFGRVEVPVSVLANLDARSYSKIRKMIEYCELDAIWKPAVEIADYHYYGIGIDTFRRRRTKTGENVVTAVIRLSDWEEAKDFVKELRRHGYKARIDYSVDKPLVIVRLKPEDTVELIINKFISKYMEG